MANPSIAMGHVTRPELETLRGRSIRRVKTSRQAGQYGTWTLELSLDDGTKLVVTAQREYNDDCPAPLNIIVE